MITINRTLLILFIFVILLVSSVAAQRNLNKASDVEFKLLSGPVRLGLTFINLFLTIIILVFAISISKSAMNSENAWALLALSAIILFILQIILTLRVTSIFQIKGLETIINILFLIIFLAALYKFRNKPNNLQTRPNG